MVSKTALLHFSKEDLKYLVYVDGVGTAFAGPFTPHWITGKKLSHVGIVLTNKGFILDKVKTMGKTKFKEKLRKINYEKLN